MSRPRYRRLFPPRARQQLDEELTLHRDLLIEDLRSRGLSDADAIAQADRRLGDLQVTRVEALAVAERQAGRDRRARRWEEVVQDLRFAVRSLARHKGWTAVALLTLALGIGASTAVFSVVNSLLLHPVPYPAADRVVIVLTSPTNTGSMKINMSPFTDLVAAWRGKTHALEAIEPTANSDVTWLHQGTATVAVTTAIMPTFLGFAGEHVVVGRNFTADDAVAGAPRVAMLSEQLWRADFGADRGVIGKPVVLNGSEYIVTGVMPQRLQVMGFGVTRPDFWLPLVPSDHASLNTVGRLRPGATAAAAAAELDTLAARAHAPSAAEFEAAIETPASLVNFKSSLLLLACAVTLVLIIACANVAHLLLARGAARQREFAIRVSLGAGQWRLLRQLITESVALTTAGCIAGLALGWVALRLLIAVRPDGLAEISLARLDLRVVLWAIGAALVTGVLFGVSGVVQTGLRTPHASLKDGAAAVSGTRTQHRLRAVLVVSEMAMAAMLLVGAALLVRSMISLQSTDVGFDTTGLFAVQPPRMSGPSADQGAFDAQILAGLRLVPGVADVTIADNAPPNIGVMIGALEPEGKRGIAGDAYTSFDEVRPGFFSFMKIPLIAGRTFTDSTTQWHEAIVSQGLAARYWPGENAIGKRFRMDPKQSWLTIVGVARDAALRGSTSERTRAMIYLPIVDASRATLLVKVQPGINPMPAIRSLITSLQPSLPPPTLSSVQDDIARTLARPRFTMLLLTLFTLIAVTLAAIGLYGVLAYSVAQRTRDIGIRMALGATRTDVLRRVIATGIGLAATGAAIGLVAAHWATTVIGEMLYGVKQTDFISFAAGTAVLLGTAALACIVPARRAVAIDPVVAMRAD